jgi:hypothetical protein
MNMLFRIISVVSLMTFLLLSTNGVALETALLRSGAVFMILFTVMYISIFFINIIQTPVKNAPKPEMQQTAAGKNEQ